MSNQRSPYQPALPKKKPVSNGYPQSIAYAKVMNYAKMKAKMKASIEEKKAQETLQELGVTVSAVSVLALLQDPEKLDEVVRKLNLKAFW